MGHRVTYGFSYVPGPASWYVRLLKLQFPLLINFRRFPLAFQFIFIFILFATVPWLPESPRWLIAHGGNEEAMQIIADLETTTIDDPWVITECKEIQWAVR